MWLGYIEEFPDYRVSDNRSAACVTIFCDESGTYPLFQWVTRVGLHRKRGLPPGQNI